MCSVAERRIPACPSDEGSWLLERVAEKIGAARGRRSALLFWEAAIPKHPVSQISAFGPADRVRGEHQRVSGISENDFCLLLQPTAALYTTARQTQGCR
jgi:hypothetical protein